MPAFKIRLRFTAPLHIAARGVGFERVGWIVHSDTLYSAIFSVWNQIDPDEAQQHLQDESPPPFLLSSAFPYHDKAEFYPKPLAPLRLDIAPPHRKPFSKVQFIEAALFQKIASGESPPFAPECTRQGGRFWVSPKSSGPMSDDPIVYETETPRVVVDRVTNHGMLYFVSELRFAENAGLFFWAQIDDQLRERFMQVLRVLGDEGLGLDRTSGKGLFEVVDNPPETIFPGAPNANRFLTLSLYHPTDKEITPAFLQNCGYELVQRGGYVSGHSYRRQTLAMFAEGSTFSGAPDIRYGDKRKVLAKSFSGSTLAHDVYRYGYAFPIGFHHEVPS
jgi:CRISPR-associated protein Csm4